MVATRAQRKSGRVSPITRPAKRGSLEKRPGAEKASPVTGPIKRDSLEKPTSADKASPIIRPIKRSGLEKPVSAEKANPSIQTVKRGSLGKPPSAKKVSPITRPVKRGSLEKPPSAKEESPITRPVKRGSLGKPPSAKEVSPITRPVKHGSLGKPPSAKEASPITRPVKRGSLEKPLSVKKVSNVRKMRDSPRTKQTPSPAQELNEEVQEAETGKLPDDVVSQLATLAQPSEGTGTTRQRKQPTGEAPTAQSSAGKQRGSVLRGRIQLQAIELSRRAPVPDKAKAFKHEALFGSHTRRIPAASLLGQQRKRAVKKT